VLVKPRASLPKFEAVVMLKLLPLLSATDTVIGNVPLTVGVPTTLIPSNVKPAGKPLTTMVYGDQPPAGVIGVAGYTVPTWPGTKLGVGTVNGNDTDMGIR